MFQTLVRPAALLLASLLPAAALAGRPLQTEDAGVLERGACEVEGAAARVTLAGAHADGRSLQLGCGIGLNTQLALAATQARAAGVRANGQALGGKTGLWQGEGSDNAAALTLAYGAAWEESQRIGSFVRAVYSRPLGAGTLHANLGVERDDVARDNATVWALAYEHEGFDAGGVRLQPMAELFGAKGESAWWNLGLRATLLPEKFFVDASWGRQTGDGRLRLVTLGFKIAF